MFAKESGLVPGLLNRAFECIETIVLQRGRKTSSSVNVGTGTLSGRLLRYNNNLSVRITSIRGLLILCILGILCVAFVLISGGLSICIKVSKNPTILANTAANNDVCKVARIKRAKMPRSCIFTAINVATR